MFHQRRVQPGSDPTVHTSATPSGGPAAEHTGRRRGAFLVLAFLSLIVAIAFVAFSVDAGHVALNKTLMQNAVDAAALAAAMEITHAIENAPPESTDPAAFAREQAKMIAADTAADNGVYVDPSIDVDFGRRSYNPATGGYVIEWGIEPSNAVKVKARRDNDDTTQPDGKLPVLFAGVLGSEPTEMRAEAIAYIESRDIAVVLDFSGSMRYDSLFYQESVDKLGVPAIDANLRQIFTELDTADGELGTLDRVDPQNPASAKTADCKWLTVRGPAPSNADEAQIDVTFMRDEAAVTSSKPYNRVRLRFTDDTTETFYGLSESSGTYAGTGSNSGKEIKLVLVRYETTPGEEVQLPFLDSNDNVMTCFQLNGLDFPFNSGSWNDYINYVRNDADIARGGLEEMYGGVTFAHYLLERFPKHSQTPELAKTSHYPFHAVRSGNEIFVDFLDHLGFGDHVGLISYDQMRRVEEVLSEDGISINLSHDPIDDHYGAIKTIMQYKQASNYHSRTNIGGGIREARQALADHGRPGARPTILLMTDGNANVHENEAGTDSLQSGFVDDGYYELPASFDWSDIDFGDGTTYEIADDGNHENKARLFAISQALKAADEGFTVHTLAVGAGADRDLMRAIAIIGGGEYISVEGNLSVEDLQSEVEAGFFRIAALVPPARLANPDEQTN